MSTRAVELYKVCNENSVVAYLVVSTKCKSVTEGQIGIIFVAYYSGLHETAVNFPSVL